MIAEQAAEDRDVAATRVWAAGECLKKAGASLDVPLVLHSTTADHWVLFDAGSLSIATWVAPARNGNGPLAMAVLVGGNNHSGEKRGQDPFA